jgi:hypothetical protein
MVASYVVVSSCCHLRNLAGAGPIVDPRTPSGDATPSPISLGNSSEEHGTGY